jgi:hypothetical protein
MRRFKFFSNAIKFFALFGLICNTAWAGEKTIKRVCDGKPFEYLESFAATVYAPSNCINPPTGITFSKDATQQLTGATDGVAMAKAIFKTYCSAGSQKTAMQKNVKIIMPKVPTGLPLDQASKIRADLKLAAENRLKDLFTFSLSPLPGSRSDYKENNKFILRNNQEQEPFYFRLPVHSLKEIENHFANSLSISDISTPGHQFGTIFSDFLFIVYRDGLMLGYAGDIQTVYFTLQTGFSSHWYAPSGKPSEYKKEPFDSVYFVSESEGNVALREATLLDLALLVRGYSIVAPSEKQRDVFGTGIDQYNDDGTVNIKAVLALHDQVWRGYFEKFVSIQAAQTDDAAILSETVKLDLNNFCKYATFSKDLVSK